MTHAEIHLHRTTTLTPEQYVAGLTDFGPGRSKLFGNSADENLNLSTILIPVAQVGIAVSETRSLRLGRVCRSEQRSSYTTGF
jgi:hypothetical protein